MYLGSDSSPGDNNFSGTLGKVQSMRRENCNIQLVATGLSPYFSWDIDSLGEVSAVGSPDMCVDDAIPCLTDIKTEPGLQGRSKKLMHVSVQVHTLLMCTGSRPHIPSKRLQDSLFGKMLVAMIPLLY